MKISRYFLVLIFLAGAISAQAQSPYNRTENLPYYDQRAFHYGILIGVHSSIFKLNYSEAFLDSARIHSIMPRNSAGFSLGGVVNYRATQYLDLRVTPTVGFYEYNVDYNYLDRPKHQEAVSSTNVELPFLLKYKSARRKNIRMYLITGAKVSIEASGKKEEEEGGDQLRIRDNGFSIEYGFGLDIYYPLFKFSPEIRFSQGLNNVFQPEDHQFSSSISKLKINTITLYLIFQ